MIIKLLRNRRGAVSLVGAITLPVLLGVTGLAAEYGNALVTRVDNQRIADLAAYSGALAYNYSNQLGDMTAAVTRVASFNGIASGVSSALVTSPSGSGKQAVKVAIATTVPLVFSRFAGTGSSLTVPVAAYAEMSRDAGACIIGLSPADGNNVALSGGTKITAAACTVASNKAVVAPCGTKLTAITVAYDSAAAPVSCSGSIVAAVVRRATVDPLIDHAGIAAARARLSYVQNLDWPGHPGVPGGKDVSFGWDKNATRAQATAAGCRAKFSSNGSDYDDAEDKSSGDSGKGKAKGKGSGSGDADKPNTWTLTCTGTTLHFGSIKLAGGQNLNFNVNSPIATVYKFSGHIMNVDGGDTMRFGKGQYLMDGGIMNAGAGVIVFDIGDYWIGTLPKDDWRCENNTQSICNSGKSITFGAGSGVPSKFKIACGIYNGGGGYMSFGDGIGNSYKSGVSRTQYGILMRGGSTTIFADMSGLDTPTDRHTFELAGKIITEGGSCLIIGAATNHDQRASIDASGAVILGAGNYTVGEFAHFGANNGGDVNCGGSVVGVKGTGVAFFVEGANLPTTGNCANQALCFAAGYGHVDITAPSSGPLAKIVAFGTGTTGVLRGALFAQGAGVNLSGAFYFPNGPVALTGGATIGEKTGQCLMLIGKTVSLSGGTVVASTCIDAANASQVALVQ